MIVSLLTVTVVCLLLAGSAALYLLPLLIGCARRAPDIGAVAAINILLGWTVLGWAAALAMALRSAPRAAPAVQVVQNLPAPPGQPPAAGWAGPPGPPPPRPGFPPPMVLPPHQDTGQDRAGPQ